MQKIDLSFFYLTWSYIATIGQKKVSTITRSSRLDVVPRTWVEDDDDLWHPK